MIEFLIGTDLHYWDYEDGQILTVASEAAADALGTCRDVPEHLDLLLVGMAPNRIAKVLAREPPRVSRGNFIGCLGYMEGGTDFWGVDGVRVVSDGWAEGRDYALTICRRYGRPRPRGL